MPIAPSSRTTNAHGSIWPSWEENRPFALALLLTFAFLIAFLMARTTLALGQAARLDEPQPFEHQISVEGTATVSGVPDIASVTLGVDSKGPDVASAQATNAAAANAMISAIAALGIAKDDIQTANYNVYENTKWNPDTETYETDGWMVSQQVTVKVRDTAKIASVLDTAGKRGATSISGPNFTIDDASNLRAQARAKAIEDAETKARALAKTLGVRLERVVGFSEWVASDPMPYRSFNLDMGGSPASAPEVLPGSSDVTLNVSVTYKLAE